MRPITCALIILFVGGLIAAAAPCAVAGESVELELVRTLEESLALVKALKAKADIGPPAPSDLNRLRWERGRIRESCGRVKTQMDERLERLGPTAAARHRDVAATYDRLIHQIDSQIDTILKHPSPKSIQALIDLLNQAIRPQHPPKIIGHLPYGPLNDDAHTPVMEPVVVPAYHKAHDRQWAKDLKVSDDKQAAGELTALAQSLDWNPVAIYEYVKNKIATQWYYGSMKGPLGTRRQGGGNDSDQAALLVSLLRAAGYPARYIHGVIEFFPDIEKAQNLIGVSSPDALKLFFQKAGIPFEPVMEGGRIVNFRIEHVWVEALIPWGNYRGAAVDAGRERWVAMDTSIKVNPFEENTPADLPPAAFFTGLRSAYFADKQPISPLSFLKSKLTEYLAGTDHAYEDLLYRRTIEEEVMDIIPPALQFTEVAVIGEYTEIPDRLRHKVSFSALRDDGETLFSETLDVPLISNHFLTLQYEPETVEDQETINTFFGLDQTPPYLVRLRPVLVVDGKRSAVGRSGLAPGEMFTLQIELISPSATTRRITNLQQTGEICVLSVAAGRAGALASKPREEKDASRLLAEVAADYANQWTQGEDELAALLRPLVVRPLPTLVTAGSLSTVEWLMAVPVDIKWQGVFIDADLRTVETIGGNEFDEGETASRLFLQLSGLHGSYLEGRCLADAFNIESVSTVHLLRAARREGLETATLDGDNIQTLLPQLALPDYIKSDLVDAVTAGYVVTAPGAAVSALDWTGYGYIKEDPHTRASGWMLSGGIAGGMTAGAPGRWDDYFTERFTLANSQPAATDSTLAASLKKASAADFQQAVVGAKLPQPLQVMVLDASNRPIAQTEVTFKVLAGGGRFEGGKKQISVRSNMAGIAGVPFYVGAYTGTNPIFVASTGAEDKYLQQVGENLITAEIPPMGIQLKVPFTAYGFPGKPAKVDAGLIDSGALLAHSGRVEVRVLDRYGNPVANQTVTISIAPAVAAESCEITAGDPRDTRLFPNDAPCLLKGAALYGDCAGQSRSISVTTRSEGAVVSIMGGGIPGADNAITVSCGDLSATVQRRSISLGNCSGRQPPAAQFMLANIMTADLDGHIIDAVRPGESVELKAKIYYLQEENQTIPETLVCGAADKTCDEIVGTRQFNFSTDFMTSDIRFNGHSGTAMGNGVYRFDYPVAAGVNTIAISGSGEIPYTYSFNDCAGCLTDTRNLTLNDTLERTIYGVTIDTPPEVEIAVDDQGLARCDAGIRYTIAPAQYTAADATLLIFKDNTMVAAIPVERQGSGLGTIARGFHFDPKHSYFAQLSLNYQSAGQMESSRIKLSPMPISIPHITLKDPELHPTLMMGDRVTFLAETEPAGRTVKWSVHPENPEIEVSIDETSGVLTVGRESGSGWVRVRAQDAVNPCIYRQAYVSIGCSSCSGADCAGTATYDLGSIDVKIGLGKTRFGGPAGHLMILADTPSPALLSPAALTLSTLAPEVEERRDPEGRLRQVLTPQYLADIVVIDSQAYEIRRYNASQVSGEVDGLYTVSGPFEKKWTITAPRAETQLVVTETTGTRARTFEYLFDPADGHWQLRRANGLSIKERREELMGDDRIVTDIVKDATGRIDAQVRTTYHRFAWGEEVTLRVVDPDGAALTTATDYYNDEASPNSYGKIKQVTSADGSWTRYEYDDRRRISKEIRPWLDAPPQALMAVRETVYDYEPVDSADIDPPIFRNQARTISELIDGTLVGRTFQAFILAADGTETVITEQVARQNGSYGRAGNRRSVTVTHPPGTGGPESGRVQRMEHPDGRIVTYAYDFGGYTPFSNYTPGDFTPGDGPYRRTIEWETKGVPNKSTRSVTITGEMGETLQTVTEVYTGSGFVPIAWTVRGYDEQGRLTVVGKSDGTIQRTQWSCCTRVSETSVDGIETTYDQYDDLNRLTRMTRHSLNGEAATTFTYDAAGRRLTRTTDGGGLSVKTATEYDPAGRVTAGTDHARRQTLYQYPEPLVSVVIRPGGITEETTRFRDGRTKSVTGSGVVPRYYSYGVSGDGTQWTQVHTGAPDSSMWERTTTDLLGRTVRVERPGYNGMESTQQEYDAAGRLVRTRITGRADTLYEYDAMGHLVRSGLDTDQNGLLEPTGGDRISDHDRSYVELDGKWWSQSRQRIYAAEGDDRATTVSIQRRQLTGLEPGVMERRVTTDIHGNQVVEYTTLDPEHQTRVQVTDDPDSTIDARQVTIGGRLVSRQSTTGGIVEYVYDGLGRRTRVTDPRTGTTVTHYDELGQIDWVEDPAGRRTRFTYDPDTGRRIGETDAEGKTTRFAYDEMGRLLHTWGDRPYPVSYAYDDLGRMRSMTTYRGEEKFTDAAFPEGAAGDTTRWSYHPAGGLLESKIYPDGSKVGYAYTEGGRLARRTWARTKEGAPLTTTYDYDPATGELLSIDYSDDTTDIRFDYDRLGRRKEVSDAAGTRTFIYNDRLQLESEGVSGLLSYTLTRTHDAMGRPGGFSLDDDYAVTYDYDRDTGRFASLDWQADGQEDKVNYNYLPDSHLLEEISTAGGRRTHYTYAPLRNLVTRVENRRGSQLISQYDYQYDALGRRTLTADSGTAFAQVAFSAYDYNDRYEVTGARRYLGSDTDNKNSPVPERQRIYAYDSIGNRTRAQAGSVVTNYAPANAVNQYTIITQGTQIYYPAYDADGNLQTAPDGMRYSYNAENRLIRAQPENPVNGDTRVEFVYDYMGRRVKKTIYTFEAGHWASAATHLFIYNGWNLVKQTVQTFGKAAVDTYFIWGLDLSRTLQGAGGNGGLLATVQRSLTYHYLFDANGNVAQMIDAADGAIAAHYEYDPFGNAIRTMGKLAGENPFRFSTKFLDSETGLYYYGYRYYSPDLGRWINRDPMAEGGGLNLYALAFNNPVNLYDILGLSCDLKTVAFSSLKGAALGYLKTLIAKKVVTTGIKVISTQFAPIAGQMVGLGISAWEVYSFGKTAYMVYVNVDKIQSALSEFYDDPKIKEWINCLTPEECDLLAQQLGEVIGSFVANQKEMREGVRRVKDIIKRFMAFGKAKFKNSRLSSEIGAVGGDVDGFNRSSKNLPMTHPFSEGASHITTTSSLSRFPGSKTYGGPDGLFVAPKSQIDDLLSRSSSRADIELGLGLEKGSLGDGDVLRIDIQDPLSRNLNLPETGNIHFRPGKGLTTGGLNEGTIESPLKTDPNISKNILGGF